MHALVIALALLWSSPQQSADQYVRCIKRCEGMTGKALAACRRACRKYADACQSAE